MVRILREADKTPVADVAKKHGVAEQKIYVWRQRFARLDLGPRAASSASSVEIVPWRSHQPRT